MKLSLCITFWSGDQHFVPRCLKAFENQTCAPDEVILSSSDFPYAPYALLETTKIADKEVPVKSVNRINRGFNGYPRNQGAHKCDSDFIMFFDVDDIPHPQKIEATLNIISKPNVDAFLHNYQINNTNFINYDSFLTTDIYGKDPNNTNLLSKGDIHHSHITVRPEIVREIQYNEHNKKCEDGEFCQDLFDAGYNIKYCNCRLVCYNR